jgi:hypothetical protein
MPAHSIGRQNARTFYTRTGKSTADMKRQLGSRAVGKHRMDKQPASVAAYGPNAAFNVTFADCRGRCGTLFASDLLLLVGSWRCGYENEQGFAAKMLRPYEAAYAQIRQRQRRSFQTN